MASTGFDELLSKMTAIADAVNKFESDATRSEALNALLNAFHGSAQPTNRPQGGAGGDVDEGSRGSSEGRTRPKAKNKTKSSSPKEIVEAVRNLDLRPKGKTSFDDFAKEKKPKSNQDRFAVAVYWLEQVAGIGPITKSHIAAIFKQTKGWREPGNIRVGLTTTASRKNTIDTSDIDDLKTTPHGRNFVEYDLPDSEE